MFYSISLTCTATFQACSGFSYASGSFYNQLIKQTYCNMQNHNCGVYIFKVKSCFVSSLYLAQNLKMRSYFCRHKVVDHSFSHLSCHHIHHSHYIAIFPECTCHFHINNYPPNILKLVEDLCRQMETEICTMPGKIKFTK